MVYMEMVISFFSSMKHQKSFHIQFDEFNLVANSRVVYSSVFLGSVPLFCPRYLRTWRVFNVKIGTKF